MDCFLNENVGLYLSECFKMNVRKDVCVCDKRVKLIPE